MQPWIRQLSIMLFATLMLFSATGVAIYHHICGCPSPVIQPVQLADHDHTCCDLPEMPVCCEEGDHSTCDTDDSHHCTNEVTYLKAPIISTTPPQEIFITVLSFEMPDFRLPDVRITDDIDVEQLQVRPDILPPRAGRPLFIFLQQLKIPSPEDHC